MVRICDAVCCCSFLHLAWGTQEHASYLCSRLVKPVNNLQARDRPATLATGLFDDLDAPTNIKQLGASWPYECIARALQTPFTDQWGAVRPLQVSSCSALHVCSPASSSPLQTALHLQAHLDTAASGTAGMAGLIMCLTNLTAHLPGRLEDMPTVSQGAQTPCVSLVR